MWDFPNFNAPEALAAAIYERGGLIASVYHGNAALTNIRLTDGAHLVEGRRVSAFTNEEEAAVGLTDVVPFLVADALTSRGAQHVWADDFTENVVVDDRLVTGQSRASARGVAEETVKFIELNPNRLRGGWRIVSYLLCRLDLEHGGTRIPLSAGADWASLPSRAPAGLVGISSAA